MQANYLDAMARAANSVSIVTTDGPAGRLGVTVSAMCSVSVAEPAPTLLVCINEASPVCAAIEANNLFCANLLSEHQQHVSDSFAGRTQAQGPSKFDCAKWHLLSTGAPVLAGALAAFDCRLVQNYQVGTHRIFVGEVEGVDCAETGRPLLYHDRKYSRTEALELPSQDVGRLRRPWVKPDFQNTSSI